MYFSYLLAIRTVLLLSLVETVVRPARPVHLVAELLGHQFREELLRVLRPLGDLEHDPGPFRPQDPPGRVDDAGRDEDHCRPVEDVALHLLAHEDLDLGAEVAGVVRVRADVDEQLRVLVDVGRVEQGDILHLRAGAGEHPVEEVEIGPRDDSGGDAGDDCAVNAGDDGPANGPPAVHVRPDVLLVLPRHWSRPPRRSSQSRGPANATSRPGPAVPWAAAADRTSPCAP